MGARVVSDVKNWGAFIDQARTANLRAAVKGQVDLEDRSRRAQKWVNEEFYKVLDVFGFRSVMFVEWGFRPADVRRTTERIKSPMAVVKQWVRTAEQEQKLAEEAEASGHRESAAEFYYRAALYYGPPCGVIHANTPRKLELYQRMVHCYTRFTELFDEAPVRRVEIPFENGKTIPGILQTVPGAKGKTPVVLVIPGMDTIKEYMPSPYHNHFRRRGMATLSIDGPGQGESNTRETWVTLDNFERAGKAALDFIETIPELDASKVGIYGWSMGSYWGPRVAAFDRACQGAGRRHGQLSAEGYDLQALQAGLPRQLHVYVEHLRRGCLRRHGGADDARADRRQDQMSDASGDGRI